MKINLGKADRILRIVVGLAIIGAGVYFGSWVGVIGMILLVTGFINFCPIYHLIGINTCSLDKK